MSPVQLCYPNQINLAQLPTPLQRLDRLTHRLRQEQPNAPAIWVKRDDLTGSVLSGNKIRKLEFTLARAMAEGSDTIITCGGTQSNHCRATALLGAQLGLKVHLILRQDDPAQAQIDGNLFLDHLSGANVSIFPKENFSGCFKERLAEISKQYKSPYFIPTGASDGTGIWGYIRACEELKEDFSRAQIAPDYIVCATGSGGTQAGLTAGAVAYDLGAKVLGMAVCDSQVYFHNKVASDISAAKRLYPDSGLSKVRCQSHVNDTYIGEGYGLASGAVLKTIGQLAQTEGLVLDPTYTAKAFHGMLEEIKKGQLCDADDIVFVHTGGVFGLMARTQEFNF